MRILSVANQKGGCGKTTVAVNLASALARRGRRVLVVDNDPQGHASMALGVGSKDFSLSTRDFYLTSDIYVEDARIEVGPRLHVVPSDIDLSSVEAALQHEPRKLQRLSERLAVSETPYDVVLIDNPPNVGVLTFNALMASREVVVPVDPGKFSLDAVGRLRETLDLLTLERGHRVTLQLVASGFDLRTRYAREILAALDELYPGDRLRTLIHHTVRLREAAAAGRAIDDFDEGSRGAVDFAALAEELDGRGADIGDVDASTWSRLLSGGRARGPGVEFIAEFPRAKRVAITGDFTGWSVEGEPMELISDGRWRLEVPVPAGCYEYKYIVDGVWKVDPENPERVRNSYGQLNSIIVVPAADDAS